jgi:hypothetical protein
MKKRVLVLAALGAAAFACSAEAAGPFIAAREALRLHSWGVDHYDVWVCKVPRATTVEEWQGHARLHFTASSAARILGAHSVAYFRWLSGGRYRPQFRARGAIVLGARDHGSDCKRDAEKRSAGAEGVVVVTDVAGDTTAFGTPDECLDNLDRLHPCAGKPTVLPGSRRGLVLGSHILFQAGGRPAHYATIPHELGHALTWPHSFTGRLFIRSGGAKAGIEYDDPVDIMGFEALWTPGLYRHLGRGTWTKPKGTQVFNRYAAGWLEPGATAVKTGERPRTYTVAALGSPGVQLLALAGPNAGEFLTIEARLRRGFDRVLPYSGVSLHVIDQNAAACSRSYPGAKGCWGEDRRNSPAPTTPNSLQAFLRAGESRSFGAVEIRVVSRSRSGFRVRIGRGRPRLPRVISLFCSKLPTLCK